MHDQESTNLRPKERSEIPEKYRWNLESIFPSTEAWEQELESLKREVDAASSLKERPLADSAALRFVLSARETLGQRLGRLRLYAGFTFSSDTRDPLGTSLTGKISALGAQFSAAVSFLAPAILALDAATLRQWMDSDPELAPYRHSLEHVLRNAPHIRSEEIEELLGLLSAPFHAVSGAYTMLVNSDLTFAAAADSKEATHSVFQGNIGSLLETTDRTLRESAWNSYADGHLVFKNTISTILCGSVKQYVFRTRACRHGSSLDAALFSDNIPRDVFTGLLDSFQSRLPIWHRYFEARKKRLGLQELRTFDLWAPLGAKPPKVTFEQAVEHIATAMAPLGDEYVRILLRGCLEQRWVDVYPNSGKKSGAFSGGVRGTFPFILMSSSDDVASMGTLAHELGHSMHSYYTWANQPPVYSNYSIFAAEVASNFNQALVRDHLLKTQTDKEFRLAVLDEAFANLHRYLFLMPTLARFELEVHQRIERGVTPTAADLNTLMADLLTEGYGTTVVIDRERDGVTWAEFSHLYANFYVYQYATGIAGAHALAHRVLSKEPGVVDRYLEFLSAGSSLYPLDALKRAGCDLTTSAPVERAFEILEEYVAALEELI